MCHIFPHLRKIFWKVKNLKNTQFWISMFKVFTLTSRAITRSRWDPQPQPMIDRSVVSFWKTMRDSSVENDEAEATRGQRKATNIIHYKFVSESKREWSKGVCVLTVFVQKMHILYTWVRLLEWILHRKDNYMGGSGVQLRQQVEY